MSARPEEVYGTRRTPEQHADRLREEIAYELATWGARSLAAIIATILEEDEHHLDAQLAPKFRAIENGGRS